MPPADPFATGATQATVTAIKGTAGVPMHRSFEAYDRLDNVSHCS